MIHYQLRKQHEPTSGQVEIGLEVTNADDVPIHRLNVLWIYPSVNAAPNQRPSSMPGKIAEFLQVGEGPLPPSETREFIYPHESLADLLSEVEALSSDDYEVRIRGNDDLIHRISGREFGEWVSRHFNLIGDDA